MPTASHSDRLESRLCAELMFMTSPEAHSDAIPVPIKGSAGPFLPVHQSWPRQLPGPSLSHRVNAPPAYTNLVVSEMAGDRPTRLTRPVRPRGQKRRRPNHDQRGPWSEFNIFSDDGVTDGTPVAAAADAPVSGSIEIHDAPTTPLRMTRSRARHEAVTSRTNNQGAISTASQDTIITSPAGRQPTSPRGLDPLSPQNGFFGRRNIPPIVQRMLGLPPVSSPPRAMVEMLQVEARLQARITALENENATLRRDNAALGAAVAETNNIPYNDRDALLSELMKTTNIPRDVFTRLLDNDGFMEQWRVRSRGSRGGWSRGDIAQHSSQEGGSQAGRHGPLGGG